MPSLTYQIQEEYCPEKQYSVHIRKQIVTCLSLFKKGEQIHVYEFARKHKNQLTKSVIGDSYWMSNPFRLNSLRFSLTCGLYVMNIQCCLDKLFKN